MLTRMCSMICFCFTGRPVHTAFPQAEVQHAVGRSWLHMHAHIVRLLLKLKFITGGAHRHIARHWPNKAQTMPQLQLDHIQHSSRFSKVPNQGRCGHALLTQARPTGRRRKHSRAHKPAFTYTGDTTCHNEGLCRQWHVTICEQANRVTAAHQPPNQPFPRQVMTQAWPQQHTQVCHASSMPKLCCCGSHTPPERPMGCRTLLISVLLDKGPPQCKIALPQYLASSLKMTGSTKPDLHPCGLPATALASCTLSAGCCNHTLPLAALLAAAEPLP
jgi:hypothetical protein